MKAAKRRPIKALGKRYLFGPERTGTGTGGSADTGSSVVSARLIV